MQGESRPFVAIGAAEGAGGAAKQKLSHAKGVFSGDASVEEQGHDFADGP